MLNVKAITKMASAIIVIVVVIVAAVGGYYAYTTYYATSSTTSSSSLSGPPITIATGFGAPDYSDVASVYAIPVEAQHFGIPMQEQIYTGPGPALAALLSGHADILDVGSPAVLAAIAKGGNASNIIAFASGESAQDLNLVCQGNVTSVAQLVASSTPSQNPTIGVTTLGDTSQYPIAVWLTNLGYNPNSANWQIVAGSAARLAELLSSKITCGGVDIGGTLLLLSRPGNKYHLLEPFAAMLPKGLPLEVLFTTTSYFNSHKAQLQAVVESFIASNRYFQNQQNYLVYAPTIVQNVNQSSFLPAYNVILQQDIFDPNAPLTQAIASTRANLSAIYHINGVTSYMQPSVWADFTVYQAALAALGNATTTNTATT